MTQEFTIKSEDTEALFSIRGYEKAVVELEVIELVGNVEMEVLNAKGEEVSCLENPASNAIVCDLKIEANDEYTIRITGAKGEEQDIAIAYFEKEGCSTYSLNLPLYKELGARSSSCVLFSLTKLVALELTTAISVE
jgi:hypothetical protein